MAKRNFSYVQVLWMPSCLVLFFAAIHVINVPDDELLGVSRHLGLAMCFAGVTNLVIFCFKHKKIHGCHWLLADGLSAMCLSFFPLFNQMIPANVIPFFFGIWELASGVLKFTESTELYEENIRGWQWFAGIGLIELISGVASMVKPIDDAVGINHVIAIIFLVQSVGFLFKLIMYRNLAASIPLFMQEHDENKTEIKEKAVVKARVE